MDHDVEAHAASVINDVISCWTEKHG